MVQQQQQIRSILFLLTLVFFVSCHHNRSNPAEQFNEKTPGRKVVDSYSNSNPQVVYFYDIDEKGKVTSNKVGEMYYYEDSKVFAGGAIKNNKREGAWKAYHPNGKVQTEGFYIDGEEDGEYIVYYDNGKVFYSGEYNKGLCSGVWKFYDKKGKLEKTLRAEGNTVVCGACERCNKINQNTK